MFCRNIFQASQLVARCELQIPSLTTAWHVQHSQVRFRRRSRVKKFTPPRKRKKVPLIPKKIRTEEEIAAKVPLDDVWITKYYPEQRFCLTDTIDMHRETCMPAIMNQPDALLYMTATLNMRTKKKTKFLGGVKKTVAIPHWFEDGTDNRVIAFCKSEEEIELALKEGAAFAGAEDLVDKIVRRELQAEDYEHVVCTVDVLPMLSTIRRQLGVLFPNKTKDTLGPEIDLLVKMFVGGKTFESKKQTESESVVTIPFGKLNMDTKELVENYKCFIDKLDTAKGVPGSQFIIGCQITSPPSPEKFTLERNHLIASEKKADYKDKSKDQS